MATRILDTSPLSFRRSPFWYSVFVVVWAVWAVFTVSEYVDDSFGLPAFLLALVGGVVLGSGSFAWFARTHRGRTARRLYDDAPLGQQFVIGVILLVPVVVLVSALVAVEVSLVLLEVVWVSAVFGYYQSAFVSVRPVRE